MYLKMKYNGVCIMWRTRLRAAEQMFEKNLQCEREGENKMNNITDLDKKVHVRANKLV